MAKVKVLNQQGVEVETIDLNDAVFSIEPNNQAMFDAVQVYRSNSRQATSKTKTRAEVRGGGRKPWRQKGTGRARHGSIRSPQWVGGGVAFGPTGKQNFKLKMNKKVRVLALKSALSTKFKDNAVIVVDKVEFEEPKTKQMVATLEALKVEGKAFFVFNEDTINDNAILSSLNIPTLNLAYSDQINVYDILNCKTLILTKDAAQEIQEVLTDGAQE
ncbi:TPA: 50S ribosomal protein L4 [bacterium]|jgi:large subunit ribosomal protein L4|nr:50S ribosomal protein L4 [bacterium]